LKHNFQQESVGKKYAAFIAATKEVLLTGLRECHCRKKNEVDERENTSVSFIKTSKGQKFFTLSYAI